MKVFNDKEIWFVTGSQHLYGPKVLEQVAKDSQAIADGLNKIDRLSVPIINKGTVVSPEDITQVCQQANNNKNCIGLILWMHTFSPSKMWIAGLTQLNKPFMHLHTQFNAALPWESIDMNFMNLNQSAHGGREFGFIGARLGIERKIVVGHWQDAQVHQQMDDWFRAAIGVDEGRHLKVARFGDNMRQVAVTEGNKVSAQIQFGYEVHAFGLGDLAQKVDAITDAQVDAHIKVYQQEYDIAPALLSDPIKQQVLKNEAKLELGMHQFLTEGGFGAFTNCFENLTGLTGLPGLATQRLMQLGFGYGGEGDWKTAAMVRIMKVMSKGLKGGTSFMEDYTYHFNTSGGADQVLGSHMLEVCPTIAAQKPKLEIHKHTIGMTCDVARLRFTGATGPAIVVSPIDLGNRFRIILNEVQSVKPPKDLEKLPIACTLFEPKPDLKTSAAAWIIAGGAHHNAYSLAVTTEMLFDYAEIIGCELVVIDNETRLRHFKNELKQNSVYYRLQQGV